MPGTTWGIIQDATIGYGYRPWLAGLWLLGLLAAGTAFFTANPPTPFATGQHLDFSPLAYTLDLLLPIINLGQENAWKPQGIGQTVAYTLIITGWILATAVIAGLTHILNRT